jgi:GST-like protein
MIDLHYWPTPNGWKVAIFLEESGLPYKIIPVNINCGEQFTPEFTQISPNGRIPAIVDHSPVGGGESVTVFESGAILQYLAEKCGKFLPAAPRDKYRTLQWLYWQVGGLGPMAGQLSHFVNYAPEKLDYPLQRYRREYIRLLSVLNTQLEHAEFIAGEYSIADMAAWPWLVPYKRFEVSMDELPHLLRWHNLMKNREGVKRGVNVGKDMRTFQKPDDEARRILFGTGQQ